jgi:hypothetical protein
MPADFRHTAFPRGEARGHPGGDDVGPARGDHLLGRDVRAARLDRDVKVLFLVEPLGLRHVIARELGLRDPFQLQRDLVLRLRGAGNAEGRRGPCDPVFHCLSSLVAFVVVTAFATDART